MAIKTFIFISVLCYVSAQERKITSTLNPGLENKDTAVTLIHVRAEGPSDAVHQIWDFTQGVPTAIFALTKNNASLNVTWDNLRPTGISLMEQPFYTFAAVIDKLYEYNDIHGHGEINEFSEQKQYHLKHVLWNRTNLILNDKEALVEVEAKKFKDGHQWRNGTIHMRLDLIPYTGYAVELPHLIHTANSSLVDVSLINMTTTPGFKSSRFAFHFILASAEKYIDLLLRKSLDDEHTPGVFEIIEIKMPRSSNKNDDGGFMQFRPIGYTSKQRGVTSSTNAHVSRFNATVLPEQSTVKVFYDSYKDDLVNEMFVSFGEAGDGCYRQSNYTSWSFTIGYGLPPTESFSFFVIMVISIGLGVPVVLALSGIVYVIVRKYKQRNVRSRLNNEE